MLSTARVSRIEELIQEDNPVKAARPSRVISVPLPIGLDGLVTAGDKQFFDDFMNIIIPIDRNVTTFARIPGAFEQIYTGKSSVGAVNRGLSQHQEAAISYYVLLAVHALFCQYLNKVEQKEKNAELQNIYKIFLEKKAEEKKLQLPNDPKISPEQERLRQAILQDEMEDRLNREICKLNRYLQQILMDDKALQEKYDAIQINHQTKALCFQLKVREEEEAEEEQGFLKKIWKKALVPFYKNFIKPLWDSGKVAAIAFWLIWITAAATTGMQLEGVASVPTWLSIGFPALLGGTFLGKYFYNAYKNGGFDKARQQSEAEIDTEEVMRKALLKMEFDREHAAILKRKEELEYELGNRQIPFGRVVKHDDFVRRNVKNPDGLFDEPLVKGTFTLVSGTGKSWSGSQTVAWYGKVFLETLYIVSLSTPLIGTVLGAVMLGVSGLFAIANAVKRYKEANALKTELQDAEKSGKRILTLDELEALYKIRVAHLESLKQKMHKHKEKYANTPYNIPVPRIFELPPPKEEPKTLWGKFIAGCMKIRNHPVIDAWDTSLDGIVLGRVLFATAAIFLPFTPVLLTGPIGVAVILAIGAVYLGMKWYENYQKKKEERIRQIPDKLEELENNIKEAELVTNNMSMSKRLERDDRQKVVYREHNPYSPPAQERSPSPVREDKAEVFVGRNRDDGIELDDLRRPLLSRA